MSPPVIVIPLTYPGIVSHQSVESHQQPYPSEGFYRFLHKPGTTWNKGTGGKIIRGYPLSVEIQHQEDSLDR